MVLLETHFEKEAVPGRGPGCWGEGCWGCLTLWAALAEKRAAVTGAGSVVGSGTDPETEDQNSAGEEASGDQAGTGSGTERGTECPERKERK